jgi:SAM-dependent methyltransferase
LGRSIAPHDRSKPSPFEDAAPFVIKSLQRISLIKDARVLDLPCGFGRHAIWLAKKGYQVVAADLDHDRLDALRTHLRSQPPLDISLESIDAEKRWPFAAKSFDLVVIVDYVGKRTITEAKRVLRKRGYLLYQSFGAHGLNWRSLPKLAFTQRALSNWADVQFLRQRATGPDEDREVIRFVAQKRN